LCHRDKRNSFYLRGAGPAGPSRFAFTAETLAPRSSAVRGELLGDYTNEAWRRVGRMLFGNSYEQLTGYDRYLTKQYRNPGPVPGQSGVGISYFDGRYRTFAPPELVVEVNRAYFRLVQYNKIDAWFEAEGFDLEKPISKEEFERRLTEPAPSPKITNAMIDDHVLVDPKLGIGSKMAHPTQDACIKAWEAKHGSAARDRVRVRYNTYAEDRGIPVKPGPRSNSAK
jgi:hypothetical protein